MIIGYRMFIGRVVGIKEEKIHEPLRVHFPFPFSPEFNKCSMSNEHELYKVFISCFYYYLFSTKGLFTRVVVLDSFILLIDIK